MPEYEVEQTEIDYFTQPQKVHRTDIDRELEIHEKQRGQGMPTETVEGETEPEILVNPPKYDLDEIKAKAERGENGD